MIRTHVFSKQRFTAELFNLVSSDATEGANPIGGEGLEIDKSASGVSMTAVLPSKYSTTGNLISVYNNSGQDLVIGDTPVVTGVLETDPDIQQTGLILEVGLPTTDLTTYVVCYEPIEDGTIGLAYSSGLCQVNIIGAQKDFAKIDFDAGGTIPNLVTSEFGAPIVWQQSGIFSRMAVVIVGAGDVAEEVEIPEADHVLYTGNRKSNLPTDIDGFAHGYTLLDEGGSDTAPHTWQHRGSGAGGDREWFSTDYFEE